MGTLRGVTLPTGGQYTLTYEPHTVFDSVAAANYASFNPTVTSNYDNDKDKFIVGGARVREVRLRDHLTGTEQVRTYNYTIDADDPDAYSSGRILRMPRYMFAAPIEPASISQLHPPATDTPDDILANWKNAAIVGIEEMGSDPFETRDVGYGRVTETVTGRGRTVTTFAMTGHADESQHGDGTFWQRSLVKLENRPSNVAPYTVSWVPCGFGYDQYPFPPNPNLDFRRGLTLETVLEAANLAGTGYHPVQKTQYHYSFANNQEGTFVAGISYDYLTWIHPQNNSSTSGDSYLFAYAPYRIRTNFSYLLKEKTETLYDQASPSQNSSQYTRYGYNQRGMLASVATRRGTGDFHRTRYKYVADYLPNDPSSSGPVTIGPRLAAQNLRQSEGRGNDLVETISEIITPAPGSTRRIIGASLNTFTTAPAGLYSGTATTRSRLYQTWNWQAAPGALASTLAQDSVKAVTTAAVAPATGNVTDLRLHSRYQLVSTIEEVSAELVPLSVEARTGRRRSGTHLGYKQSLPVLQIDNALASEVVFSNFEDLNLADAQYAFQATGIPKGGIEAHTGKGSVALTTTSHVVATPIPVTPVSSLNPTGSAPTGYRLSFWANPTTPATLTLQLSTNAGWTPTVSLSADAVGKWRLYEVPVPAATNPAQLQLHLTANQAANQAVYLDDILLLPIGATARSATYNPTVGKTADVDASGRTTYYEYDQAGQRQLTRDHNRAIVSRVEQAPGGRKVPAATALTLSATSNQTFTVSGQCAAPFSTITWNFGDGTPSVHTTEGMVMHALPTHMFPRASITYTVQATVYTLDNPQNPVVLSLPVVVSAEGLPQLIMTLCMQGATAFNQYGSVHDFTNQCDLSAPVPAGIGPTVTRYVAVIPDAYRNYPAVTPTYTWYRKNELAVPAVLLPPGSSTTTDGGQFFVSGATLDVTSSPSFDSDECHYICTVSFTSPETGTLTAQADALHPDVLYNGLRPVAPAAPGTARLRKK